MAQCKALTGSAVKGLITNAFGNKFTKCNPGQSLPHQGNITDFLMAKIKLKKSNIH